MRKTNVRFLIILKYLLCNLVILHNFFNKNDTGKKTVISNSALTMKYYLNIVMVVKIVSVTSFY